MSTQSNRNSFAEFDFNVSIEFNFPHPGIGERTHLPIPTRPHPTDSHQRASPSRRASKNYDDDDLLYIPPSPRQRDSFYIPPPPKNKREILRRMKTRFGETSYGEIIDEEGPGQSEAPATSETKNETNGVVRRRKKKVESEEELDQGTVLSYFMFYVPNLFFHGKTKKREPGPDPRLAKTRIESRRQCLVVRFNDYKQEIREKVDIVRNSPKFAEKAVQFLCLVAHTEPIIQRGPTCGMVALTMAANAVRTMEDDAMLKSAVDSSQRREPLAVESVIAYATEMGFTSQGELYSCNDARHLAEEFIRGADVRLVRDWRREELEAHLLGGGMALVPYDSDHHYDPDTRMGRKAHWAVLLGCLAIVRSEVVTSDGELSDFLWKDKELRDVVCRSNVDDEAFIPYGRDHMTPLASLYHAVGNELGSHQIRVCQQNLVDFYVIARQGKHHFMGFWKLDRLLESNAQLFKSEKRRMGEFVLNDGSVEAGLARQIILLKPRNVF